MTNHTLKKLQAEARQEKLRQRHTFQPIHTESRLQPVWVGTRAHEEVKTDWLCATDASAFIKSSAILHHHPKLDNLEYTSLAKYTDTHIEFMLKQKNSVPVIRHSKALAYEGAVLTLYGHVVVDVRRMKFIQYTVQPTHFEADAQRFVWCYRESELVAVIHGWNLDVDSVRNFLDDMLED